MNLLLMLWTKINLKTKCNMFECSINVMMSENFWEFGFKNNVHLFESSITLLIYY